MMQHDQPTELRDYLTEAEAVVTEWYSRAGVTPSHDANLELLATLAVLQTVMSSERTFYELTAAVKIYLTAAFQMGRACGNCSGDCQ
ncbi:MAG: hypothetical protein IPM49_18490 [Flavobacteriales bacterium]|nr:hypothetical protein [Flavobacteriales bacterium]